MGKYMREMEVSQVVGVRTRAMTTALAAAEKAAKKRKAVTRSPAAKYQMAYLQLRSRSLVRISRSDANSFANSKDDRVSISESNASCDVLESGCGHHLQVSESSGSLLYYSSFINERREMTPKSNQAEGSPHDLESTAEIQTPPERSTAVISQIDAEIQEFFAEAERKEARIFANKYNFDAVNDVPLEGRYHWIQISQ